MFTLSDEIGKNNNTFAKKEDDDDEKDEKNKKNPEKRMQENSLSHKTALRAIF